MPGSLGSPLAPAELAALPLWCGVGAEELAGLPGKLVHIAGHLDTIVTADTPGAPYRWA
jgi:hypothetical protein